MEFINDQMYRDKYGIYQIRNIINNKVYIGQTRESFQRRFWHHRWKLNNKIHDNKYLQLSCNKYGIDNFVFEVLYIARPNDNLDKLERAYITSARADIGCYNIQDGGQPNKLSNFVSPESRKRVGEINRKRMTGKKLSQETKEKMSQARKGKRQYKSSDLLTDQQVVSIKEMLINHQTSREIMEALKVPYKAINGLISNNTYNSIHVDGWDEFLLEHQRQVDIKKMQTKALHADIVRLYTEENVSKAEIARILSISWHTVNDHLKKESLC